TNARRSAKRKPYSPRATQKLRKTAPRPAGQLLLLPELNRPIARLRDFGGGTMPPSVAREIEFLRRQRGVSQAQLASLVGRSQGQLANALRGHDPISGRIVKDRQRPAGSRSDLGKDRQGSSTDCGIS